MGGAASPRGNEDARFVGVDRPPQELIARKRDGRALSSAELRGFLGRFLGGSVTDAQMAAFMMAVYFRGMSPAELDALIETMISSGDILDGQGVRTGPRVDKHSTGGIGDKVSLVLAPLAAELGCVVPMMSGRGLGHTGGTLDKLESIPGFKVFLGPKRVEELLERVGCAMVGQTETVAPLDRKLYALRDVTGTVPSIPLVTASIMSKKLAESLDGLVLDVKVGRGAFFSQRETAEELARSMTKAGRSAGVRASCLLTAMDRPLGRAVGNALEVREALACLEGKGPQSLREVVLSLASEMLVLGGLAKSRRTARGRAEKALDSGGARRRFQRLIEAQGGDPEVVDDPDRLPSAPLRAEAVAERGGILAGIDPLKLGYGVIRLGGGRTRTEDPIDPSVGFVLQKDLGDEVSKGEPLITVHARSDEGLRQGLAVANDALSVEQPGVTKAEVLPLVIGRVGWDRASGCDEVIKTSI